MKNNQSLKAAIGSIICIAILALALHSTASATVKSWEDVEKLKMRYEQLYRDYTTKLSETNQETRKKLADEVTAAKNRYEEARKMFSLTDRTKESIKNTATKVKDTVKKVFSSGNGSKALGTSEGSDNGIVASGTGVHLPGFDQISVNIDGDNYCGQFAMTTALNGMGIPAAGDTVYKMTNPAGIFTGPSTIVEYLRMSGVDASSKHNASIEDIIKKLDDGKPVITLVNSSGNVPHWICITGYDVDSNGKVKSLSMRDSYWGTKSTFSMEVGDFMKKWEAPLGNGFLSGVAGYKNLMIDIAGTAEKAFSPPLFTNNFWTATEDNMAAGINDTVTGFKRLSPTQLAGGVLKLGIGIPGAVTGVVSNGLSKVGSIASDWGKTKWNEGGTLNKVIGGAAVVGGTAAKVVGVVGKTAANALSTVASVFGNGIKKLGYVFAR